jgi:hypothetical protein
LAESLCITFPIYFKVSPLVFFFFQNSFLVPALRYDVLQFLPHGQPTLMSINKLSNLNMFPTRKSYILRNTKIC